MLNEIFMDRVFRDARYRLTSDYNLKRVNPVTGLIRPHWGRDFGTYGIKCILFSPVWGVVTRSEYNSVRGHFVEVKTPIGFVLMQHLHYRIAKVGQLVNPVTRVGACGTSGSSTGVHLHIEYYNKEHQHVHPDSFIKAYKDPVFQTYIVTSTLYLHVRNKPSVLGAIVSKLAPKTKVKRYAESNGWIRIRYTLPWWVSKRWLRLL